MDGNGNGNPTRKDNQPPAQPATTLQITLTWDQLTGNFNINGFLANKVVVLGMLDLAKDVFLKMCEQNEKSGGIVLAPPQLRM